MTDAEVAVHVIHDNEEWLPPLRAAFAAEGVPLREILLDGGALDLAGEPQPGVYWSRFSASSAARGRPGAKDQARAILGWLEAAGTTVVNGTRALDLEVSKVRQHAALAAAGFDVPRTVAAFGRDAVREAGRTLEAPFITKHNQGGKGLGVRLFESHAALDDYVASPLFEESPDGVTLVQEYLVAAEPFVTRAEFVGGRFAYAVRVDTSAGAFELCPADACVIDPATGAELPVFSLHGGFAADPIVPRLETFLADAGIGVAGIEFMDTADGRRVVYDINTNTNYNALVEASADIPAARLVARYLGDLLVHARAYGGVIS